MLCQFQNGVKHFCTSNIKKVSNFFPRRSNIQQRFSFSRQFQFLKNQLLFVLKTSDCRTISTQSTCVCTLSVHTIRKVKFMIGGGLVAKNDRPFFLTPTVRVLKCPQSKGLRLHNSFILRRKNKKAPFYTCGTSAYMLSAQIFSIR